jgi:hypothetical protein
MAMRANSRARASRYVQFCLDQSHHRVARAKRPKWPSVCDAAARLVQSRSLRDPRLRGSGFREARFCFVTTVGMQTREMTPWTVSLATPAIERLREDREVKGRKCRRDIGCATFSTRSGQLVPCRRSSPLRRPRPWMACGLRKQQLDEG